jgi:hypothetical protein
LAGHDPANLPMLHVKYCFPPNKRVGQSESSLVGNCNLVPFLAKC